MADTVQTWCGPRIAGILPPSSAKGAACRLFMRRRSTIALLMCLPLILIIAGLVVYPAFYSIYLSMLNKAQTRFIGLANFTLPAVARHLLDGGAAIGDLRAVSAVFFKALIGLITAHLINNLPGQGPAQMARHAAGAVGHPAGAVDARLVVAVRPHPFGVQLHRSTSLGFDRDSLAERSLLGALFGHPGQCLVRRAVLPDHVSGGAEIGARAAL